MTYPTSRGPDRCLDRAAKGRVDAAVMEIDLLLSRPDNTLSPLAYGETRSEE